MHFLMYLLAVTLQAPDSGAFVITLGKDTIGMERYTRTADRLVDDMVMRDRAPVISRHFVATLGADGLISHIELDNKPVVASAVSPMHAVGRYTKDAVFVELTRNGQSPPCRRSISTPSLPHSGTDPSASSRLLTRCGSMSPALTSPSTTAAPPCAVARSSATSSRGIRCGAPAGTSPRASQRPPTSLWAGPRSPRAPTPCGPCRRPPVGS